MSEMALFLQLPNDILDELLSSWIDWRDFVQLDSALCNSSIRKTFFEFLRNRPRPLSFNLSSYNFNEGAYFNPSSPKFGKTNPFILPIQYSVSRNVRFTPINLTLWPFFDAQHQPWLPFMTGVKEIRVVDETERENIIACVNSLRDFQNLESLFVSTRSDTPILPLSSECQKWQNYWPKLKSLSLDVPAPVILSRSDVVVYDEDCIDTTDTNDDVPLEMFESLRGVFSNLTTLSLTKVELKPVSLYVLFGEIDMVHLEYLVLQPRMVTWDSLDYYSINLNHVRGDEHDEFVCGDEDDFELDDDSFVEEFLYEDDIDGVYGLSADYTSPVPIEGLCRHQLQRPRPPVVHRITNFDDFCGWFEQRRQRSLPHLKSIAGNYLCIYPLLHAAGGQLEEIRMDYALWWNCREAEVSMVDSTTHVRFPSLATVQRIKFQTIDIDLPTRRGFETDVPAWRKPMTPCNLAAVLTSAAPSLQSLTLDVSHQSKVDLLLFWLSHVPESTVFPRWQEILSIVSANATEHGSDRNVSWEGITKAYERLHRMAPTLAVYSSHSQSDGGAAPSRFLSLMPITRHLQKLCLVEVHGHSAPLKYASPGAGDAFLVYELAACKRLSELTLEIFPLYYNDDKLCAVLQELSLLEQLKIAHPWAQTNVLQLLAKQASINDLYVKKLEVFNDAFAAVDSNDDAVFSCAAFESAVMQRMARWVVQDHPQDVTASDDEIREWLLVQCRRDVSYVTTRSLDTMLRCNPWLKSVTLGIPCLDLTAHNVELYARSFFTREHHRNPSSLQLHLTVGSRATFPFGVTAEESASWSIVLQHGALADWHSNKFSLSLSLFQ